MECPKCHALIDDDSLYCDMCGVEIEKALDERFDRMFEQCEQQTFLEKYVTEQNILLALGMFFVIIGISVLSAKGVDIESMQFGGNFYTYAYASLYNVVKLLTTIKNALGWIIIILGTMINIYAFNDDEEDID